MRIADPVLDAPAEEGARIVALGLVAEGRAAAEALRSGSGDEPLHDFRVAVRRLRSVLRSFRPWLADGVRRRHEQRLKKLARSTNAARDAEVQVAWLADQAGALGSRRARAGYDLAVGRLEARARRGAATARVADRYDRAADRLERRLGTYERKVSRAGEVERRFGDVLASLVDEQVAVLAAALGAVEGAADADGIHRARIEGKRLRYLLEPLRGLRGANAGEAISRLKRLQDVLGELHDAHVLSGALGDLLADEAAAGARRLHAAIADRGGTRDAIRDALRGSPRAGLIALLRLVRDRRDARYAELEHGWQGDGMDALESETRALARALEARTAVESPAADASAPAPSPAG